MFEWIFGKGDVKRVEDDTKRGFEAVKKDITSVTGWIKHLDSERNMHQKEIELLKGGLSTVEKELDGIKNVLAIMNDLKPKQLFKTPKQLLDKQTAVYAVQTGVQTGVQTPNFEQFSVTERAILWILINSDMKLSYEDLASMLGKEKSTIRGQINSIKQKSEGLVKESIENNGKKRVYIPEEMKEKFMKKQKVRVRIRKKMRMRIKTIKNRNRKSESES